MFNIFADNRLIYQPGNEKLRLISPKLTVEMGKAGSLEFTIPPTHTYFNELTQLKTILTVTMDDDELFRGRVFSNKRNFNNTRDIYGEGNLAYLVDSVQKGEKYTGKAHALFKKIIAAHNKMVQDKEKQFTVGSITVEDRDVFLAGQSDEIIDHETSKFNYKQIAINSISEEWKTSFDYIESCLLDYAGGYLRTRRDDATGTNYIDWLKDYYAKSTQTIEFGKNMLDLTEEINAEDVFTVLIPLGDENLTIASVNKGSVELSDPAAVAKYGRIVKTNVFDAVTNPQTLLENGKRYLANNSDMPITITVTAVDLHLLNPNIRAIYVGDKVHVLSHGHDIDNSDLVCTKIEYDLSNPANTVYTFGNPKQTLTERYRKDKKEQDKSAGRGGGGGGTAAEEAKEEVAGDIKEIFDAYIDVRPEDGKITLKALYEKQVKTESVLKNNVGIDLDAPSGKINIYADHNEVEEFIENNKELKNNITRKLGIDLDAPGGTLDLYSMYQDTKDNKENIASIELWSGKDGSKVAMKADLVKIEAKVTEITGALTVGGTIKADKYIEAPGIYVNHLLIGNYSASLHTHTFSVSGGTVHIGGADWTGADHSFNIADTKFYKDAVASATKNVKASGIELRDGMIQKGASRAKVKVTLTNGRTQFLTLGLSYYPESGGGGSSPQ